MKKITVVTISLMVASTLFFTACPSSKKAKKGDASLKIEQVTFKPGEAIIVEYTALASFAPNAWIGIIPSKIEHGDEAVNDQHDITYKYLNNSTSGKINLVAPKSPGSYDIRMHDTDNDGVEVTFIKFTVEGDEKVEAKKEAPKSQYNVGDPVMVEWKGRWWPARVIAVGKKADNWKIHYDGYGKSWDEWVEPNRIKRK